MDLIQSPKLCSPSLIDRIKLGVFGKCISHIITVKTDVSAVYFSKDTSKIRCALSCRYHWRCPLASEIGRCFKASKTYGFGWGSWEQEED